VPSIVKTIPTAGGGIAIYSASPEGAGPFAAIVVIQHAPGLDTFTQAMAGRLAEAGYCAVAPDLYHRQPPHGLDSKQHMEKLKDTEVIADVNAAVDYLRQDPMVAADRLGIIGFCMGGRVAYLMASANRAFKAAVVYYGGNTRKAWGEGPTPFARTAEIGCPVLYHFGADDTNPSPEDMRALDTELARHGKPHEFYSYSNAAHAFMNFTTPERYREAAANTSWPRTLDFLSRHLRK
jgi:carboxymethylenebutenolidase